MVISKFYHNKQILLKGTKILGLNTVMYLLICCDTRWATKLLRLALYLKHVALPRATVTVAPTVLTTVHGEVVGRAKLREAGITAKFMHHILVINFMSNLGIKKQHTNNKQETIKSCSLITNIRSSWTPPLPAQK